MSHQMLMLMMDSKPTFDKIGPKEGEGVQLAAQADGQGDFPEGGFHDPSPFSSTSWNDW